jgi:hypothetical protein
MTSLILVALMTFVLLAPTVMVAILVSGVVRRADQVAPAVERPEPARGLRAAA